MSTAPELDYRHRYAAALRAAAAERGHTAVDLARFLGVGRSAASKRLRGTVPISGYEQARLDLAYGLSVPPAPAAEDLVLAFRGNRPPAPGAFDPDAYLARLHHLATSLAPEAFAGRGADAPPALRISSTDIPVIALFGEPALAALKLFFFATDNAASVDRAFDLDAALESLAPVLPRVREIHEAYAAANSREVWGHAPLDSFLHQIVHLARARALCSEDADAVFAALRRVAAAAEAAAVSGRKSGGGAFALSSDRLHVTSPIYLLRAGQRRVGLLTVAPPGFLVTDVPAAVDFLKASFERTAARAVPVDGGGALNARAWGERLTTAVDSADRAVRQALGTGGVGKF